MFSVMFYRTPSQREVVLDWIKQLEPECRKTIGFDFKTVQLGFPMGLPLCRSLGDGLWEVRSSLPNRTEARLVFFQHKQSSNLVVVHAFIKKSQKTPKPDLDLALRRKREIEGSG
jgi:phage-related protein